MRATEHAGASFAQAETYRRTVVALMMQLDDGQWRCVCHLKTVAELPTHPKGGEL